MAQGGSKVDKVVFWVNGEQVSTRPNQGKKLLDFLRYDLKLTGVKRGCGTGHCGSCTVIVDGIAIKSCIIPMEKVQGKKVETIEGLTSNGVLHPIQQAFLDAGAVQCGFCTPGMIMATKALLDKNKFPSENEIKEALKHNICRCTGYVKIIEAVKLAVRYLREGVINASKDCEISGKIGRAFPDYDGVQKVQGSLKYADDLIRDKMLFGKIVWSKYPHAQVLDVQIEAALQFPGVYAVLTAKDIPGLEYHGLIKQDQPVLCRERVRFTGDPIAVVFAESKEQADEAAKLVEVKYLPLPGIFSPAEAILDGAPQIHPEGNICKNILYEVGDIEEAKKESYILVQGHFKTPAVEHAYLEPESGMAFWEGGLLNIFVPTQFPFEVRHQVAQVLALPEEKVRVVVTPLGGGFGGKCDVAIECLLALGAYKLNRPVKITLNREESMRASTKRHPFELQYEVGASQGGKLLFVDAKLISDAGPYTGLSPKVMDQACIFSCGPYEVPNLRIEGWAVHTNNANAGAMRGFGINQAAVAIESLLDELGQKLHLNPFEIRRINALDVGKKTITGQLLNASVGLKETINRCEEALNKEIYNYRTQYLSQTTKKLGVGVASGFKNVGAGAGRQEDAGAIISLEEDGTVLLKVSGVDMGQGFRTAILQIVVETTGLAPGIMRMVTGDTLLTPKHSGAAGERQTLINGNAAHLAALEFKNRLLEKAASMTHRSKQEIDLTLNLVVDKGTGEKVISLIELAQEILPEKVESIFSYLFPPTYPLADAEARKTIPPEQYKNYPSYAYTTQVALVEVDTLSGKVKVLKVFAAHDVGVAINPQKIAGQIEGSLLMGQGYALSEEYVLERGVPRTKTIKDCGIPTIFDMPEIQVIIVEDPEPEGPFGAKGISEVATVPITPAIMNAICDAIGRRVYTLPVRAKHILELIGG